MYRCPTCGYEFTEEEYHMFDELCPNCLVGGAVKIKQKRKVKKKRYMMILDSGSKTGSLLSSGKVYLLDEKFGEQLVKKGRARPYTTESAKRIVILDGVEMAWGDYLKRINKQKKKDKINKIIGHVD
jgi:hypothetical protein